MPEGTKGVRQVHGGARARSRHRGRRPPHRGHRVRGARRTPKQLPRRPVARDHREGPVGGKRSRSTGPGSGDLAALAKAFEAKFKIKVVVNRNVDSVLLAQVNTEQGANKLVADIWVPSLKGLVLGSTRNGWLADGIGPNFFKKRFDRKAHRRQGLARRRRRPRHGLEHEGGSGRCHGRQRFLASNFTGRIGVPDPRISPSFMAGPGPAEEVRADSCRSSQRRSRRSTRRRSR